MYHYQHEKKNNQTTKAMEPTTTKITTKTTSMNKTTTKTTINKARYTATPVACGWAGAIVEVNASFGQEQ